MLAPKVSSAADGAPISSWPTGANSGDQAVLIQLSRRSVSDTRAPVGWTLKGRLVAYNFFLTFDARVWTRVVSGSTPELSSGAGLLGKRWLATFAEAGGIGQVRYGVRRMSVQPLGGLVVLSDITGDDSDFAGLTLINGTLTLAEGAFTVMQLKLGWAASAGGGEVGVNNPREFAWSQQSIALEITPPVGPAAPSVASPSGEVSNASNVASQWAHNPMYAGGKQDAFKWRVRPVGGSTWQYWDATTSTLVAPETTNLSASQTISVDPAAFTAGVQYEVQVSTREQIDGRWSPWSPSVTFTPVTPPSVTITSSATVVGDLNPPLTWNAVTPRGAQTHYRVLYQRPDLTTLLDTGWQTSAAQKFVPSLPPPDWTNGAQHPVTLRVRQTGGSESPPVTQLLNVSWSPPTTPEVVAANGDHGVSLLVNVPDAPAGVVVEIQRREDDGDWKPVTTLDLPASGPLILADVLAPFGALAFWRARAGAVLDGVPLWSAWGESGLVVCRDRRCYLVDALAPDRFLPVRWAGQESEQIVQTRTVTYTLGADHPRLTLGPRQGISSATHLWTETVEEREELLTWLVDDARLILRYPPESGKATPTQSLAVSAAPTVDRAASTSAWRKVSFGWVSQPEGEST